MIYHWLKESNLDYKNKKQVKKIFIYTFFCLFFLSCNPEKAKQEKIYFDFPVYFKAHQEILSSNNVKLKKYAIKDGQEEVLVVENPDWGKELLLFKEIDLNREAWSRYFKADTLLHNNDSVIVFYTAMEKTLPLKELKAVFVNNSCKFVTASFLNDNILFTSKREYEFDSFLGYSVSGSQEILSLYKTNYRIKARFINQKNQ
jgi:hypothetical protein